MFKSKISWINEHAPELKGKVLVTVSMEGYIPELKADAREANTRGGLGIYFGDKLEGLAAIGMEKAFGCMPLYKKRLVQSIKNGRQNIEYKEVSYDGQPFENVLDGSGRQMKFSVWGWDRKDTSIDKQFSVSVYSISRGGTLLYLFYCPDVFDVLYPDDLTHSGHGREHRFLQETVFAECVYELLRNLKIVPDILHLNEGHVAGAAAKIKGDEAFDKTAVVYTNHTVVSAGLEKFSIDRLTRGDVARARYAMRFPWPSHQMFWKKFSVHQNGQWYIDFSKGALEICDMANGVSTEHADAMQSLFPAYDRRIEAVLNGSGDTWVMAELLDAAKRGIPLSRQLLTETSRQGKVMALTEVKKRTAAMTNKAGKIISENGVTLDPELPTIWMVRRMVFYKSQLPVLKDIVHVICADRQEQVDTLWGKMNGLQMQLVIGGIAPEGSNEQAWIEEFVSWMEKPQLKGRFVFVPDTDTVLLRAQAVGADICLNCPLPEQEACGTSDQRSARNGGINVATRSGGPIEYIEDGKSGMLVGPYQNNEDFYKRAPKDILDKLRVLSEMYFSRDSDSRWFDMKQQSLLAGSKVTAFAMEQKYAGVYTRAMTVRKEALTVIIPGIHKITYVEEISELLYVLQEAARDFLYRDPVLKSWTVVAGLPFFDQRQGSMLYNWARDTMISLPGLCIERDRYELFRDVVKNYLRFVKNGILPNLVGDGSAPRYNSADSSLWLIWAVGKYLQRTGDYEYLGTEVNRVNQKHSNTIADILEEIIAAYKDGIHIDDKWLEDGQEKSQPINIYMDKDYLISAGSEDIPLTWMDVKPQGKGPVSSRHGKAVEINALWYNALKVLDDIKKHKDLQSGDYTGLAEKVKDSFGKFWNPAARCLYDTIDGDPQQGGKIRPNQIFAVVFGLLDSNKSLSVMSKVRQELLTVYGLRTLSPIDPDYHAVHYNEYSYHQGTVLPWLMGAFIEACILTYGRRRTMKILFGIGYFDALSEILEEYGSVPELMDGSCTMPLPTHAKGCKAQAWNVGESLRGLSLLLSEEIAAEREPTEISSMIVYEMVIRDYYDAKNKISGLSVALQELPFIAESAVEYIYLLGLIKHTGNPFDIIDPIDIDPRAGTFAELDVFVDKAHSLGMKVIVDWLANQHVSKSSQLCKTHPDWFLYTDAPDGDYYIDKGMQLFAGRSLDTKMKKNLVLVSATDEVPIRSFPRRWTSLAQPDLSHPQVREHALEVGRFWLSKGFDGFRIDAALSTFPDKIKENWHLDVEDNLTLLFIEEMRTIKPDCFIMFEGFERLDELLQLADYEKCAVYNWRPRNFTTDSLKDSTKLPVLINYLKDLENRQYIRDELVNLGPEHDAFDFGDPWAKLDYQDRLLLNFLYISIPGYMLVFNGQIFGKEHIYKKDLAATQPAPRLADADSAARETGKRLFGLRKEYPQFISGDYVYLENSQQNVIHLARFDDCTIVIAVINTAKQDKKVKLSMSDIINWRLKSSGIECSDYARDVLHLQNNSEGWVSRKDSDISVEQLLQEGLPVEITGKSCMVVRLRVKSLSDASCKESDK